MLQSFWLRLRRRGSILTPTESAQAFCKKKTSAADHLTCHFQGHYATLVSLPFRPLQSASVCARAAAGSVSDLQGIQSFTGGLERALLIHLVMVLHLYPLFTILCKLLKKRIIESCSTDRSASTEPPHQCAASCFHRTHPPQMSGNSLLYGCVTFGRRGERIDDNSLKLCLFWNYIRTVFYDPSYPILYPTWKRECCYWRRSCVDDDDLMKWVNHSESNFVAGCSILNVLLCSSATNSPTDWLLFLYPSLRFGNIPKSVKTIARQWSDLGCSPKTTYLCGHLRHYRRYYTYSTKVGRQVTVVPCGDSVSDHLVISRHTWKDTYSLNYCTQDRSACRCQI